LVGNSGDGIVADHLDAPPMTQRIGRWPIARMGLYKRMAEAAKLPPLVHCPVCGREERVNPAECLAHGWPTCCKGHTMFLGPAPR